MLGFLPANIKSESKLSEANKLELGIGVPVVLLAAAGLTYVLLDNKIKNSGDGIPGETGEPKGTIEPPIPSEANAGFTTNDLETISKNFDFASEHLGGFTTLESTDGLISTSRLLLNEIEDSFKSQGILAENQDLLDDVKAKINAFEQQVKDFKTPSKASINLEIREADAKFNRAIKAVQDGETDEMDEMFKKVQKGFSDAVEYAQNSGNPSLEKLAEAQEPVTSKLSEIEPETFSNVSESVFKDVANKLNSIAEEVSEDLGTNGNAAGGLDENAIKAAKAEFKASVDKFNALTDVEKATVFEKLSEGDKYADVIKLGDSGEYLRFVTNDEGQSSYEISEEPPSGDETVSDITPDEFADVLS